MPMSRSQRFSVLTWLQLAAVVGLAIYVYRVEVIGGKHREESANAAKALFPFQANAVTEIELRRGATTVTLSKTGEHWKIVAPIQSAADATTVDRLLNDLCRATIERKVDVGKRDFDPLRPS